MSFSFYFGLYLFYHLHFYMALEVSWGPFCIYLITEINISAM